jgi:hypothetical protein
MRTLIVTRCRTCGFAHFCNLASHDDRAQVHVQVIECITNLSVYIIKNA